MEILDSVEDYCESIGLELLEVNEVFHGNIHFGIMCENENVDEQIQSFLNLAITNGVKHIVYKCHFFNLDKELEDFERSPYHDLDLEIEDEIDESNLQIFQNYREYDDEICQLELYWTKEGATYTILYLEDWYQELKSGMDEKQQMDRKFTEEIHPKLPRKLENEIVEKIASSDEYYKIHTRLAQFPKVFKKVLGEKYTEISKYTYNERFLRRRIADTFHEKYKEQKENEFHDKILELEGGILKKKNIVEHLGITDGMFELLR